MSPPVPAPSARDRWSPAYRHVLQPLLDAWYGRRTRSYVGRVERRLRLGRPAHERARLAALRDLLCHARDTVPFYRERMRAAGFDPARLADARGLAALPALTRRDVAQQPAALLSDDYRRRGLVEARSGGTTSTPVPFMQPRSVLWRKNAAAVALRRRLGWEAGDRSVLLWGAVEDMPPRPTHLLARWKTSVAGAIERVLWLPAADLSPQRLDDFAQAIRRHRPVALQAYPSAADLLARRILERHPPLRVPVILLTAETVFPAQRKHIAAAFGGEVVSFYGAREVGWIASECRAEKRLHLNTDGIHLEVGDEGRLLVTDLLNRAMPLVRYEVGDRGELTDEACPCGDPRPVLAALHGRVNDVFVLPSGRRVPGAICDVRNYQLVDGIVESQLVQEVPDRIRVRWVAGSNFRPEHVDVLRRFLDGCFQGEVRYDFEQVERIEPEPNGKTRYCISHVGVTS